MTTTGTYIKALFLLIVFSMNALVSFACSFGDFLHSLHHQHHSTVVTGSGSHDHQSNAGHHHDEGMTHEHHGHDSEEGDDCCSEEVSEVEKVDKSLPRTIEAPKVVFLSSFIASFSSLQFTLPFGEKLIIPELVRWRILSTIPDLRIVIQSFQI